MSNPIEQMRQELARQAQPRRSGFAQSVPGSGKVRMIVEEVLNDFLVCRQAREMQPGSVTPIGPAMLVARPDKLRHRAGEYGPATLTTINAQVVRIEQSGEDPEVWRVHWPYRTGDTIWAERSIGGTGVWVEGQQLQWLDSNVAARVWMLIEEQDDA